MTLPAIEAEGLSKRYRIGGPAQRHDTLRDLLASMLRSPFRNLKRIRRLHEFEDDEEDVVWALRDVSFQVAQGEILGVVGKNGAGKSTLLKILSRITEPTSGRVLVRGQVSALLEVGTGFHPELTGRENIYLNGSILGMDRREIDRKFEEIVEFSGVAKFIDTPVKWYSSGMSLRLAFSVAAHLEPEVLIVDEVLAVGDADFQRRCLGKMEEVGGEGRTVVLVSHNLSAITRLCTRTLVVDRGGIVYDAPPTDAVRFYSALGVEYPAHQSWEGADAPGDEHVRLRSIRALNDQGQPANTFDVREPVYLEVIYEARTPGISFITKMDFIDDSEQIIFHAADLVEEGWWKAERKAGLVRTVCRLPANFLTDSRVHVSVGVATYDPSHLHAVVHHAITLHIVDRGKGPSARGAWDGDWAGVIRPLLPWSVEGPGYSTPEADEMQGVRIPLDTSSVR